MAVRQGGGDEMELARLLLGGAPRLVGADDQDPAHFAEEMLFLGVFRTQREGALGSADGILQPPLMEAKQGEVVPGIGGERALWTAGGDIKVGRRGLRIAAHQQGSKIELPGIERGLVQQQGLEDCACARGVVAGGGSAELLPGIDGHEPPCCTAWRQDQGQEGDPA